MGIRRSISSGGVGSTWAIPSGRRGRIRVPNHSGLSKPDVVDVVSLGPRVVETRMVVVGTSGAADVLVAGCSGDDVLVAGCSGDDVLKSDATQDAASIKAAGRAIRRILLARKPP